ncbi:hypothetical protein [Agrococcus sp. ProA11]|uniref:hypothetical protein n=1 Tax=Agrococcus chionoecetis TaxID=3153752 RepID=UPI003260796C
MSGSTPRLGVVALALVMLLTGCGAPTPSPAGVVVVQGTSDLPRLEALAEGVVVIDLDGCLGIESPDAAAMPDAVLVLPEDAQTTENGARLAGGLALELGSTVDIGGGLIEEPLEGIFELPTQCDSHPAWAVHDPSL